MCFNYQVFNTFLPNGTIVGLSTNYYILLNLTSQDNNCPYNYRDCGILDTLGHKLCIDRAYSCPINSLIADYDWKENELSYQWYYPVNLTSGLSYNYRFYYSNKYYSHAIVNLMKTYYKPKYINFNNFYLDLDAIKEFLILILELNQIVIIKKIKMKIRKMRMMKMIIKMIIIEED